MTEGSISQKIIFFAIPLFLGNLFQQLYNTADSLIVGNFLGSNALAAVSSSGNLIFLMVGFINGIAMGAGVVIARYYGAKKRDCLQKAIHTTVAFGLVAGAVLTVLGMLLAPKILVLMGTPADVLPESIVYFRTYFAGSMGVVMYNIFVGVLQSVGDGRHPLIYLIISSCVNVVLDIFFIAGLGMGVGSAALATAISQFVSALLCMVHLLRVEEEYRLELREIRFDSSMLKQIIQNGVPSGFQNSVIAIANVFVQSNINAFGKMAMAGCGSYSKIELKQGADGFNVPRVLLLRTSDTQIIIRDVEVPGRLRRRFSIQGFIQGSGIWEGLHLSVHHGRNGQRIQFFVRQLRHDLPQTVLELLLIDYFVIPRLSLCAGVNANIRFAYIADFAFDGSGRKVNDNIVPDLIINGLFGSSVKGLVLLFVQFPDNR